ncbi:protein FAM161A isoform X1 [Pelodiscus sinensis]|uniref:protein FAM161A isoform X1 n=1 Tax=Pelodiscus sinensis TaxID=13735 RepID=UPI0003C45027|nr:protein FAM161A isoform X1 [Pelodiscus sinensis]|eukprot:XP_006122228.1 protein FAM161A isoform X1 [Pelodiscus sinensis]
MDAAHRAALLTASCLRTPVNPRTRAPVALYERERRPAAAVEQQDDFDLDCNTERQQSPTLSGDCKDLIDFPKMCHSNQEYYLKLQELKNAHLETMAKLERMYQNKLHLKGVYSLGNKDASPSLCYRSTWDKSSFQPLNLHKSFSESDLNDLPYSSLSDGSAIELELEEANGSETGSLTFAKEQIKKMWDGFSVEDYVYCTKYSLPNSPTFRMMGKKQKEWSPKVTVPKPFQMTIREAKKKQQNVKSKSQIEMENNLLKKQLEEETECQKKFRANPVPASVFLPLYHEIMERNEERRKSVKERSRDILLASQKPFQFIKREEQRKEIRKMQLKDLSLPEKKTKLFQAKPVPKSVYSAAINDKLKEEQLYREIRIQMRAEELLRNSTLPNSRLASKTFNKKRKQKCNEQKEVEHKPKIKSRVPDFVTLHQKFQDRLLKQKRVKHITVCEPFNLRTPCIPSNKGKILQDIQADEEKLKETRWPYASPRCKPQMRYSSENSSPLGHDDSKSPRITESTKRRIQALRTSLEEKRKLEEEQKRSRAKQKQRAKKLQKLITTRAEANDPHQSLAQMSKSKLKIIRKHEKQRKQEYLRERKEMEERVNQRPLLLERATQKNARIAAEKHYSGLLRELGICEDFLSKKSQTDTFLGHSNTKGFGSCSEDKESLNEDKVQERESCSGEKANPQSDQSCEEGEKEEKASSRSDQSCKEEEEEEKASSRSDQSWEEGEKTSSQSDQSCEEEEEKASSQSDHDKEDVLEYEDYKYEDSLEGKSSNAESN